MSRDYIALHLFIYLLLFFFLDAFFYFVCLELPGLPYAFKRLLQRERLGPHRRGWMLLWFLYLFIFK